MNDIQEPTSLKGLFQSLQIKEMDILRGVVVSDGTRCGEARSWCRLSASFLGRGALVGDNSCRRVLHLVLSVVASGHKGVGVEYTQVRGSCSRGGYELGPSARRES